MTRWDTIAAFQLAREANGLSIEEQLVRWLTLKISIPNEQELEYLEKWKGDAWSRAVRLLAENMREEYEKA